MRMFYIALCLAYTLFETTSGFADVRFSKQGPRNFGLLVNNSNQTIYRSERLGKDGLKELARYLKTAGLPFPKVVIHMNKEGYKKSVPFFEEFAVEEFQLAGTYGYDYFHSFRYDMRTFLDGTNPYQPKGDIDSKGYLGKRAEKLFGRIYDPAADGGIDAFERILHLVLGAQQPVLFHCTGGHHRTGMIALAIRYLQGGEWVDGPKRSAKLAGIGPEVRLNPAQYEYFLHNTMLFRSENLKFIDEFAGSLLFQELKEQYADSLNERS